MVSENQANVYRLPTWPFVHEVIWYLKPPGIVFSLFQKWKVVCSDLPSTLAWEEDKKERGKGEEEGKEEILPCSWDQSRWRPESSRKPGKPVLIFPIFIAKVSPDSLWISIILLGKQGVQLEGILRTPYVQQHGPCHNLPFRNRIQGVWMSLLT